MSQKHRRYTSDRYHYTHDHVIEQSFTDGRIGISVQGLLALCKCFPSHTTKATHDLWLLLWSNDCLPNGYTWKSTGIDQGWYTHTGTNVGSNIPPEGCVSVSECYLNMNNATFFGKATHYLSFPTSMPFFEVVEALQTTLINNGTSDTVSYVWTELLMDSSHQRAFMEWNLGQQDDRIATSDPSTITVNVSSALVKKLYAANALPVNVPAVAATVCGSHDP